MAVSKTLVLVALAALVGVSAALQCVVCNSHLNAGCDTSDPHRLSTFQVTCTDKSAKSTSISHHDNVRQDNSTTGGPPRSYTYCRKTVTTVPVQANKDAGTMGPDTRVERSCGWEGDEAPGCKWQTSFGGIQVYTCKCTADGCNSAGSVVISIAALLVPALVFIKQNVF